MKGLGYSLLSEGYDNGMRDGKQIGIQEGIQEGIQKGIQLGMDQCKKILIRKALASGKSIDFIKDVYDVTLSEIEDARKDNKKKHKKSPLRDYFFSGTLFRFFDEIVFHINIEGIHYYSVLLRSESNIWIQGIYYPAYWCSRWFGNL